MNQFELLCLIQRRLRAKMITRSVTVDGPDDPEGRNAAVLYELELTNGEHQDLVDAVQFGLMSRINRKEK